MWRKSTFSSNGDCVEVFRKSTFSGPSGSCVDVVRGDGTGHNHTKVRDTKLGEDSAVLHFTESEWQAFIAGVKAGEFD